MSPIFLAEKQQMALVVCHSVQKKRHFEINFQDFLDFVRFKSGERRDSQRKNEHLIADCTKNLRRCF